MTAPPPVTFAPRHRRAIMGILLMLLAIVAYGAILFRLGVPVDTCAPTWLQLVRQYGFPLLLFIAGYNLFSGQAFKDIIATVKSLLPGKS